MNNNHMMGDNEIEKIIADAKPQISNNEKFKGVLRSQVLAELSRSGVRGTLINKNFMNSFRYWVAGAVAVAVVVLAVFVGIPKQQNNGGISLLSSSANITHVKDKAFGSLNSLSAATSGQGADTAAAGTPSATAGKNTAGTNVAAPLSAQTMASGGAAGTTGSASAGSGVASPSMAPVPPGALYRPIYYQPIKYVYTGNTFTQNQSTMDVLKYVVPSISANQATVALAQSNFGAFDLSSFSNMNLQNITFSQDQDFGYTVNVDLTNGTFYISENYEKWPQDMNPKPLTANDIPSDAAIIKIANQFLSDHGFALGNYGTPEVVQNNYGYAIPMGADATVPPSTPPVPTSMNKSAPASAPSAAMIMRPYYPDSVAVLYPLMINGKGVYDSSGNKIGLTVEINVRYGRVSNVSGARIQNYQASSYDAITDVGKILSLAENPPFYPIMYEGMSGGGTGSAKASPQNEVDFGTPTMGYVQMYDYANGTNSEFLVPAYIFPVTGGASNYVYSKNIVVPLIQDFLQNGQGKIVPMMGATSKP